MIAVYRPCMNTDLVGTSRLTDEFAASLPDIPAQHRIPVLRHPHHVILAVPNGVAAPLVSFHPAILYRNRRDPMPPKGVGFPDPLSGTLKKACPRNRKCSFGSVRQAILHHGLQLLLTERLPIFGRAHAGFNRKHSRLPPWERLRNSARLSTIAREHIHVPEPRTNRRFTAACT